MIGDRLKILRKAKGLSQKELAQEVGTSQGYICALEQNKKIPGGEILISLKNFLGVDLNWLLTGEDVQVNTPQEPVGRVMKLIDQMLTGMSEDALRDVLKYTEEKKLLTELLAGQKPRRTVNGG